MSIGIFAAHMRRLKPTRKCSRCGLMYTIDNETCPHCSELNDEEVIRLKKRNLREQIANGRLGTKMLSVAAVLVVIVFVMAILKILWH